MREMVLNHASMRASDRDTAIDWLTDMASGLSAIIQGGVVAPIMRASHYSYDIQILSEWSMSDALSELIRRGAHEEFSLLAGMETKVPLLNDADLTVANRFHGCQHATLSQADGAPLLYCAISNSVSVGFPSSQPWDNHQVTVEFEEILFNTELNLVYETIDNVTRCEHAPAVIARHLRQIRDGLLQAIDRTTLWEQLHEAFPSLLFGTDVESQLMNLNPGELGTVINKLAGIDESAAQWPIDGGPAPMWRTLVTDEPSSVKNNPSLREARRFRSNEGDPQLYMWHARFGKSGRIHLRFERASYKVEIGYIGTHLPLS